MPVLSPTSRFLVEEWTDVSRLIAGAKTLDRELVVFLEKLTLETVKRDWWTAEWEYVPKGPAQCYVARRSWRVGSEHVVWIGVEEFDAEHLFGDGEGPQVYLWVPSNPALAEALALTAIDFHNQPTRSRNYVIKKRLAPMLRGEDPERFLSDLPTAVVDFWAACAAITDAAATAISEAVKVKAQHAIP